MKKITIIILISILLIIVAGCGDNSQDTKAESNSSEETLVVGTTHASPPNAFVNSETEKPDGVMIDIIKEFADRNGYILEFETMPFSSLIPSLDSSRVNVIAAGMGITEERAKSVDFSDPVYSFTEALVVPSGNSEGVEGLENLEGKSIGVSSGTFYHDYLTESDINMDVKAYETTSEMLLDLTQGRINAAINDTPVVNYLNEQNANYEVETVDEYEPYFTINIGLIVEKGNEELLNEINNTINEMKEDGTLEKIHQEWGTTWFD